MHFDPPVSTWTDEQLEESRAELLDTLKTFAEVFGLGEDFFTRGFQSHLDEINTEIMERGLKLKQWTE